MGTALLAAALAALVGLAPAGGGRGAGNPAPPPPSDARRARRNKYASFSKAEEVARTLRFSNVGEGEGERGLGGAGGAAGGAGGAREAVQGGRGAGHAPPAEPKRERGRWLYPDAAQLDQRDPATFGFSEVGRVSGPHGVTGALRVRSDSDFAHERLCRPGSVWLRKPRRRAPREVRLLAGRRGPGEGVYLLKIEGVMSREQAAALKGSSLFIRREMTPKLEDGEILVWQLEGLQVACIRRVEAVADPHAVLDSVLQIAGPVLGRVTGVVPREELTGNPNLGNDLLEVTLMQTRGVGLLDPDDPEEADTVLIPFVDEIVPFVSLEEGIVLINPPDGLLELVQPKRRRRVVIRGLLPAIGETCSPDN